MHCLDIHQHHKFLGEIVIQMEEVTD
jgi:hypothetical protein